MGSLEQVHEILKALIEGIDGMQAAVVAYMGGGLIAACINSQNGGESREIMEGDLDSIIGMTSGLGTRLGYAMVGDSGECLNWIINFRTGKIIYLPIDIFGFACIFNAETDTKFALEEMRKAANKIFTELKV